VNPTSATLDVGDDLRATAEFRGCGGTRRLTDEITWSSQDPAIASVGASTGVITARAPGVTTITPSGAKYGELHRVTITVR
jgi:uncharacterized protein YjdB